MVSLEHRVRTTINGHFAIEGINLFNGSKCIASFNHGTSGHGIVFVVNGVDIQANLQNAIQESEKRISHISLKHPKEEAKAKLVEHVLAATYALGLDDLRITLPQGVVPTLDDMSATYYEKLKHMMVDQNSIHHNFDTYNKKTILRYHPEKSAKDGVTIITHPKKKRIIGPDREDTLEVRPTNDGSFKITYAGNMQNKSIRYQEFTYTIGKSNFLTEVARARTICLPKSKLAYEIINFLGKKGLHGATEDNCMFIDEYASKDKSVVCYSDKNPIDRFEGDEFARHKTLDKIGTLALLDAYVPGTEFIFRQTGHEFDLYALKEIVSRGILK